MIVSVVGTALEAAATVDSLTVEVVGAVVATVSAPCSSEPQAATIDASTVTTDATRSDERR
jgi:hypothetical protein